MPSLDHRLVGIALAHVSAQDFESFVNAFLPPILGPDFIPMGGVHDGGADAFQDTGVYETQSPGTFFPSEYPSEP